MRRTHYLCMVDGCVRIHSARGYCDMHWKRVKRHGTPLILSKEQKFWARVNKTDSCWLWMGCLNKDGYGQYGLIDGKNVRANRYAYEITKGKIPKGLVTDHLCRVRHCVNPDHMELVDMRENTVRGNTVLNKKDGLPTGVAKPTKNRFRARKWFNGKSVNLGYFLTAEEAHQAYLKKRGGDVVI